MVDFDKVIDRVIRGVYVGTGVVVADNIEDNIAQFFNTSGAVTSAGGIGAGLTLSVLSDEITDMAGMDRRGPVNDAMEFAGYGIQGASLNNLLEATEVTTGAMGSTNRDVIQVDAQATHTPQTGGHDQTGQVVNGERDGRVELESP